MWKLIIYSESTCLICDKEPKMLTFLQFPTEPLLATYSVKLIQNKAFSRDIIFQKCRAYCRVFQYNGLAHNPKIEIRKNVWMCLPLVKVLLYKWRNFPKILIFIISWEVNRIWFLSDCHPYTSGCHCIRRKIFDDC